MINISSMAGASKGRAGGLATPLLSKEKAKKDRGGEKGSSSEGLLIARRGEGAPRSSAPLPKPAYLQGSFPSVPGPGGCG